jgi:alpha-L-fucosidase
MRSSFKFNLFIFFLLSYLYAPAQQNKIPDVNVLAQDQQAFVNLRFGMFIHFNIPTFIDQDWADPQAPVSLFNPTNLDCNQWAEAAQSAHMRYGCLTTKHHSGFCIWDTKTTNYNVMQSPLKRDVVKEFVTAFRAKGLKVMLYYSILDTHHELRPGCITKRHVDLVKAQLTELLTHYGDISALVIDGWDAPWSRISYDDIPFDEIYHLVKSLQPHCLLMDLNAAKYPGDALFYTDIKTYEQGAGQHISTQKNQLPALSCLPINRSWFWKTTFPSEPVKDPASLVNDNLIPFNNAHCNFLLNVAPNREGKLDDNVLKALKEIGQLWNGNSPVTTLPIGSLPITASNIAKHKRSNSSWSDDMWIMDFGNDDNFTTAWISNKTVEHPWYEIDLGASTSFNMITLVEPEAHIKGYRIEYQDQGQWKSLLKAEGGERIHIHRFQSVKGDKVRVLIDQFDTPPAIAELGIYNEKK